jgi:translocation and assembly module TamB
VTRTSKYIVLAVLLTLAAIALAALGWVAGTRSGSLWLMDTVSRQTGYTVAARQVTGSLWSGLHLQDLQVHWKEGQARAGLARICWKPLQLLYGKVAVKEIVLKDVTISDNRPVSKTPPDLGWPEVTGVPAWLNMSIRKLQVDGLEYRRPGETPTVVTRFSSRVTWRGRLLTLWDLAVTTPSMRMDGELMAGFDSPSLLLNLGYVPVLPAAGLEKFLLKARLFPASRPEQLAGKVSLSGISGKSELVNMTGELGITGNGILLKNLKLLQTGRRGTVTGAGDLVFTADGPMLTARLGAADLDLARELHMTTALSGVLEIAGNPQAYRGKITIANKGAGWRAGSIAGTLQGDLDGVRLTALNSAMLGGTVTGTAQVGWLEGVSIRGALRARNLNPAKVAPQWRGVVNADLNGALNWSAKVPLRAELKARLLESRLHGKTLTGDLDARLQQDNLLIKNLNLRGKGFDLHAEGELNKRLAFTAAISDLSGLVPDVSGRLRSDGWVRWDKKRLSGAFTGKAGDLGLYGVHIAAAELAVELSDSAGYPLHLKSSLRGVAYQQFRADAANLDISGTVARHVIDAEIHATGFETRLALAGGYKGGNWQGQLTRLSGKDAVGVWNLRDATALRARADSITFSRLVVDGAPGEHLTAEGQINFQPLRGFVRAEWHALNLSRLLPLLDDVQLSGLSSGSVQTRFPGGDRLFLTGRAEASGTVLTNGHRVNVRQATVQMDWTEKNMLTVVDLKLAEGGMLKGRLASPQPFSMAIPSRGVIEANMQGFDTALLRPWLPDGFDLQGIVSGEVKGSLLPGAQLDIRGNTAISQGGVSWQQDANKITAAVHTAAFSWNWQGGRQTTGPLSGKFRTGRISLNGKIDASGMVNVGGQRIAMQQAALTLDWSERGMRNELDVSLADGGRLRGSFFSRLPSSLAFPQQGLLNLDWQGVNIAMLAPWLPRELELEGRLAGQVKGNILPGNRLDIRGNAALSKGAVHWYGKGGQFNAELDTADISWTWQGAKLDGAVSLKLAEYGQARGNFQLPLPAQLPVAINPAGPLTLNVTGLAREMGLLTSLFPGLVRESHGKLDFALQAGGTWQKPRFSGNMQLAEAGAYLPAAGISIKDVRLLAYLEQDRLRIDSFQLNSGPGRMEGKGVVEFKDWQMTGYHGSLKGDRFQIVYLPELQVLASPKLDFNGSPDKLSVRGEILVPELLVNDRSGRAPLQPSTDVVLEGAAKRVDKQFALPLDIQVNVILGDKVLVKAQGIDAQLKGNLNLSIKKIDEIRSTGVIRVVKGKYKTYGINLDIARGRIYYNGTPIDQPTLDIQALRKVEDVRAGVTIAGTPRTMTIKLYSEPNMPESAILSYIVLGQPLAYTKAQSGLITRAGGSLLTTTTGYRPIQTSAPPGVAQGKAAGSTLSQSMVSIGRYLTPELYIGYGRSLVNSSSVLRMRYSLSRHWEVESQTGSASGGDLFFKIDFR